MAVSGATGGSGAALHERLADELLEARRTGVAVAPLARRHPDLDLDDAYAVQQLQQAGWEASGRAVGGHKIGLTAPAIQAQLGVDQPDFGVLLADEIDPSGAVVDLGALIAPRVEPEIAFTLASDLAGPGVDAEQALAAVGTAHPALEVIDSRVADWAITLVDTVADNASGARAVVGAGVDPAGLDLAAVACTTTRTTAGTTARGGPAGGEVVARGTSDAVLGSPVNALVWLANTLGERGTTLRAGQVVLSGSITAAVDVGDGDEVTATLAGVGTVTARFAGTPSSHRHEQEHP